MAAMGEQHENTRGCESESTVRGIVGTTFDAEIVENAASEVSETERENDPTLERTHRRKKPDEASKQTPAESIDVPDDSEERFCREAAAEGLDPFLESIPEANREVVVARLFEDFRSATTEAKYIDNGRWRDYGAYADRGYYIIAAEATIMALHRQYPKSFTTLPAHAQELCLGLLLQLVRLAPLVTNPEGIDGTETAKDVLGRLSGAARSYSESEQPPFLVRLLRKQMVSANTLQHDWKAKWTVKLGEILGCREAAKWLRGIESARGVEKLLAKSGEGGTSAEATRVQKSKSKRVREGSENVQQAPAKKSKTAVVGGEKVRSKAQVEDSEADGGELEAEGESMRAQFEELERAKKSFGAERVKFGEEKASLRARFEELERAKKSFEAERVKFGEEKESLQARFEELERAEATEAARNDEDNVPEGEGSQAEELKRTWKALKLLKREWKDEKKTLEEQIRGYESVNEVLKKELKKYKPA